MGQETYCPVSGVVFTVKEEGAVSRELGGGPFYFCCNTCAEYFDQHPQEIARARKLLAAR